MSSQADPEPTAPSRTACAVCGTTVSGVPPTWSMQVSERGVQHVCDACTRTHLRSIEGKLDEAWW